MFTCGDLPVSGTDCRPPRQPRSSRHRTLLVIQQPRLFQVVIVTPATAGHVQQEKVRLKTENLRQVGPHDPAARHLAGWPVEILLLETQSRQDLAPSVSLGPSLGVGASCNESGGAADHDIYWEITAGYEMELSGNMTLGISGVLGHFVDGPIDTFYGIGAGLSIALSDSITVTPHITHTVDDASGDEIVTGVSVGFGF